MAKKQSLSVRPYEDALEAQVVIRVSIGHKSARIAQELGLTLRQVNSILSQPSTRALINAEVSQLRRSVGDRITRRALAEADATFDTYIELRDGVTLGGEEIVTTPATRLAAADRIMERVVPRLSVQGNELEGQAGFQLSDEAVRTLVSALEAGANALLTRGWERRTGVIDQEREVAGRHERQLLDAPEDDGGSLDIPSSPVGPTGEG